MAFMVTITPPLLFPIVPDDFFGGNTGDHPFGEMASAVRAISVIGLSMNIYDVVIAGPLTG
jgi:hypothetical protein